MEIAYKEPFIWNTKDRWIINAKMVQTIFNSLLYEKTQIDYLLRSRERRANATQRRAQALSEWPARACVERSYLLPAWGCLEGS